MNEFIVWDEDDFFGNSEKVFYTIEELLKEANSIQISKDYNVEFLYLEEDSYGGGTLKCEEMPTFPYIGKIDINNKNIYADCSIVEFEFKGFGDNKTVKYVGYFSWNQHRLRYDINILSHEDVNGELYVFDYGKCLPNILNNAFKIIDTIQENKLGLIK